MAAMHVAVTSSKTNAASSTDGFFTDTTADSRLAVGIGNIADSLHAS
jgi:hypothetical protein